MNVVAAPMEIPEGPLLRPRPRRLAEPQRRPCRCAHSVRATRCPTARASRTATTAATAAAAHDGARAAGLPAPDAGCVCDAPHALRRTIYAIRAADRPAGRVGSVWPVCVGVGARPCARACGARSPGRAAASGSGRWRGCGRAHGGGGAQPGACTRTPTRTHTHQPRQRTRARTRARAPAPVAAGPSGAADDGRLHARPRSAGQREGRGEAERIPAAGAVRECRCRAVRPMRDGALRDWSTGSSPLRPAAAAARPVASRAYSTSRRAFAERQRRL